MSHILTTCESPGQKEVCLLAKNILEKKGIEWRAPTLSLLLACCLPTFKSEKGKRESGKERFYRIIMSISIQVIWGLRCKQVISEENTPVNPSVVERTWTRAINDRIEIDCLMTRKKFGWRALKPQVIKNTWEGTLKNKDSLPKNWMKIDGVLVGIGPSEGR
ncbi:hypothetical protein IW261DRAFT_1346353 [Armillaria novae-zelandiae]|uniref:Uncharacterized protein n=1 Tax=Armillaria novae-zelandiae TaxID=153914 RepID=A0AA39NKQ7_9AGAR|nr:hypothetical protein IW261DRAFT_1346353 [Armillaria novae-zelandiae]